MKLIIAGGRTYQFTRADKKALDEIHARETVTEVVSGCAAGADLEGQAWAATHSIPVKRFPAGWETHGKAAGPVRNREMAEYADAVALFPGGKGTASMFAEATKAGLTIYDFRS